VRDRVGHHPWVGRGDGLEGGRPRAGGHQVHRGHGGQVLGRCPMFVRSAVIVGLISFATIAADKEKALSAVEARKQVGKEITVKIEVKAAKDRLEKRGEIYLDAEENFRDEKNF